jgi:hypothetical protein
MKVSADLVLAELVVSGEGFEHGHNLRQFPDAHTNDKALKSAKRHYKILRPVAGHCKPIRLILKQMRETEGNVPSTTSRWVTVGDWWGKRLLKRLTFRLMRLEKSNAEGWYDSILPTASERWVIAMAVELRLMSESEFVGA